MVIRFASISLLFLSFFGSVASAPAAGHPRPRSLVSHRSLRPTADDEEEGKFVHAVARVQGHPVTSFRI